MIRNPDSEKLRVGYFIVAIAGALLGLVITIPSVVSLLQNEILPFSNPIQWLVVAGVMILVGGIGMGSIPMYPESKKRRRND